ncbi:hypothetical protein ACHAXR_007894 [Thalassiosira sp. AJA248-18]
MEEAPVSPRGAAIYYWGGDWGEEDDNAQTNNNGGNTTKAVNNEIEEETNYYANVYDSIFQKRNSFQHRRRCAVKFQLTLHDEGDANHWMFAPPPLPIIPDLSPPPTTEEKVADEVEEEVSIPEQPTTAVAVEESNDFADPNDFNAIPIIDLSQPKHVYAQQIGDACRNVGFFYIINHGVDQEVMEGVLEKSKEFFELDLESKLKVSSNGSGGTNGGGEDVAVDANEKKGYRGYFGIGGEDLENKDGTRDLNSEEGATKNSPKRTKGDMKEGVDYGLEIDNDDDARIKFFGKNIWPDGIAGFRKTLMKYQAELIGLSDKLLLALGQSLNDNPNGGEAVVAEDYFINSSRNPMCTLRLLHYPPTNEADKSQGCGAHTDYGLFTILQQDSIGGLQVRNNHRHWIDAKPLKGSFVINVGDMLSHWTNSVYSSTVHRVVSPSASGDRYSIPFFFNPDHDAVVKPLKSVVCADGSEKSGSNNDDGGDAKTALEILKARYEGTFQTSN